MLTLAALSLLSVATAQKAGDLTPESHPPMSWSKCTGAGACESIDAEVVIDANWRWTHIGKWPAVSVGTRDNEPASDIALL